MRIYCGWVLDIAGREWVIQYQQKIRKTTWYILKSADDLRSIDRDQLIRRLDDKSIKYVCSIPV